MGKIAFIYPGSGCSKNWHGKDFYETKLMQEEFLMKLIKFWILT